MTTKERISSEIEKLSEDELKKVYGVVRSLAGSKASEQKPSFMSRLKRNPDRSAGRFRFQSPEPSGGLLPESPSF